MRAFVVIQVVLASLGLVLAGCYHAPTEDHLIRIFRTHRDGFDQLVEMFEKDRSFRRVSNGEVPPIGMGADRFKKYKVLFRELEVESGVNRYAVTYPGSTFILASTMVPIGGKGRAIGFAYSPYPLEPLVTSLQMPTSPLENREGHGRRIVFRSLDKNWYLFYEVDW